MTSPNWSPSSLLSADDYDLVKGIVATQGENKDCLRAAKPKVVRDNIKTGATAYIWRMVAFAISPITQQQCMPMCADFDIPMEAFGYTKFGCEWNRDGHRAFIKHLDDLADIVIHTIPKDRWYGINRWGRVR